MAADLELARRVREKTIPSTLRIYKWSQPAISIGRRQNPDDLPRDLLAMGIPIVSRPTGGGAVVHGPDEFTYALAVSSSVSDTGFRYLMPKLHSALREALVTRDLISHEEITLFDSETQRYLIPKVSDTLCFSSPVCGDLMYHGKKVAGCALRVWRDGSLLQGTIQELPILLDELRESFIAAIERFFGFPCQPQPLKLLG